MPSLDDINSRFVAAATPVASDIVPFYDTTERGPSPIKKTTIAEVVVAGIEGLTPEQKSAALEALGALSVVEGDAANAVAATGSITFGTPTNGDVVNVGGVAYTKVAATPTGNQYTNIAELTALLEARDNIVATSGGGVISMTAATKGSAGNLIALSLGGSNAGSMTVSGATFTGGVDGTVASGPYSIAYGDGEFLYVPIDTNTVSDDNWRKVPIANEDDQLEVAFVLQDLTGEVVPSGQLALANNAVVLGTGQINGLSLRGGKRTVTTFTTFNDTWQKAAEFRIPAEWLVVGTKLLVTITAFQTVGWTGAAMKLYFKTDAGAADPSSATVNSNSDFASLGSSAGASKREINFDLEIAADYMITNVSHLRLTSMLGVGSPSDTFNLAGTSFMSITNNQDAMLQLWFFCETTAAPSSASIDCVIDVTKL